jgi:hypothetical protein
MLALVETTADRAPSPPSLQNGPPWAHLCSKRSFDHNKQVLIALAQDATGFAVRVSGFAVNADFAAKTVRANPAPSSRSARLRFRCRVFPPNLDEQAYRFNNRKDDDRERFLLALFGIRNRRLTYKALTGLELPETC